MKKQMNKIKKKNIKNSKKINWKVVIYSIIGLICVILSFTIDWIFLLPAVICILLNQRELGMSR
jgi:1,4-dihydroxy-2-naphthoate octaprenyltransferase